ncbi:ATP-binding protein [Cellulomonas fimi]|uniref:ATP-binding protein n=1 Tax=Cellulomonas fimi TaxID=1708 RepID=UPI00234D4082|nr:ATP-binding protein [Cellulomonas fimi]MDC7120407.1 ATP-binding protein [Cellulomonas fimi]
MGDRDTWVSTTHDWAAAVDDAHLADVRRRAAELAPGGVLHLVLEVLAYASEEATERGGGRCRVTFRRDGSVSVADEGRGTDTRLDEHGHPVRKPVMSTRDLRVFDAVDGPRLPDGHPRRGVSVVAALSDWLVHRNRRSHGSWEQRYERGVPVTDLVPVEPDGTTGTTVTFLPGPLVRPSLGVLSDGAVASLRDWPHLTVEVLDERPVAR